MLAFFIQLTYALNLDCNPNICAESDIGDGSCSPSCMTAPCNYDSAEKNSLSKSVTMKSSDCNVFCISFGCTSELLENDKCDDGKIYIECNTQECAWDLGQCGFCSKKCYENMLSDGKCDEECNTAECRYDLNDCGWCAKGCKQELINNGICNSECNNADCEYDGKDCGCAPNCKLEDYGKCKSACMAPDCNYDSIGTPCIYEDLREFYKYFQLLNYDFSVTQNIDFLDCFSDFNENFINCEIFSLYETGQLIKTDCSYDCLKCLNNSTCVNCDFSKGYVNYFDACITICPEGYSNHPLVPSICYRNQDSVKIYVDYNSTGSNLDGSKEYPYKTLYDAISNATSPFIDIIMKPGIHQIDYEIPPNPIIESLTIKSECDIACPEYAFLNIVNSSFSFPTAEASNITFLNLIIDRASINNPYKIYADDIKDLSQICPQIEFLNLIEIKSNAKFYAKNTTFQNIQYNVRSVITATDCRLELYNTNFININTLSCHEDFSVIMLLSDYYKITSSFIYEKGNVFLNNGYFSSVINFGSGFLVSNGCKNIKISNVEFQNIFAFDDSGASFNYGNRCKSLFCIEYYKQAVLTNNNFNYIYTQESIIDTHLYASYSYWYLDTEWASSMVFNNSQFANVWSKGLISADAWDKISYLLIANLNISRCLFDLDIIYIYGSSCNTTARIENIWITNSSFNKFIASDNTQILAITCIYAESLTYRDYALNYFALSLENFQHIFWLKLREVSEISLLTFISASDGIISISNVSINKASFADTNSKMLHFSDIYNASNFSLENIKLDNINSGDYSFCSLKDSKSIYFYNISMRHSVETGHQTALEITDCENAKIFSSYFSYSSINIYSNSTFLGIYDTVFERSYLSIEDSSISNNYQFISCSFLNESYGGSDEVIIYARINENSLILTKNCIFKFNDVSLLYLKGGNYQDFDSIFEWNYADFQFNDGKINSNYLFNGSKFYDNHKSAFFEVEEGIMKFTDCTFERSGTIFTKSSLFIINSTFINSTDYWIPWIVMKGNWSYIRDSYFYNHMSLSVINSSSSNIEILNSTFVIPWIGESVIFIQGSGAISIFNINFTILHDDIRTIKSDGNRYALIGNSFFDIHKNIYIESISFNGGSLFMWNITVSQRYEYAWYNEFDSLFLYVNISDSLDIKDSTFDGLSGTAVYVENTDLIRIARSSFKNGQNSRALKIGDYNESYLTDLKFINNKNDDLGGSIYVFNRVNESYMIIDNCAFYENHAHIGGAIVIDGCEVTVENSKFINNTAQIGGAIVSACRNSNLTNYLINNTFIHNYADVGGAVYWERTYQNVSNNTFIDNSAAYGSITASKPIKIGIIKSPHRLLEESETIEDNLVCSLDHSISFEAALIDYENQIVSYDDYYCLASLNCNSSDVWMIGETEKYPVSGIFNFTGLQFICNPGSEIVLNLSCSGLFYNYLHDDHGYNLPSTIITIVTRNCEKGEYKNGDRCDYCKEGKFSLDTSEACENCPKNAYCYGGYQIAPEKGYWHGNIDSSTIYPCPNSDACRGGISKEIGYISLTGICSKGYRGNLCQSCDFNYSSSGRNKCEKCPSDQGTNVAEIIAIIIAAIFLLTFIVYFTLKTAYEPKSTISIYFRILINYLQMITLITRLKLNWPFYIENWLIGQGYPGEVPTHIVSIDCYLIDESDSNSYKNIYFKKMIIIVLLPATLGVAAFLFWSFIAIFQRNWKKMKNELIATLCILLFLILPSITDYMFSVYSCTDIYGELFLVSNLDIKCWEGDHLFYAWAAALPGIIVWSIGIPACVLLFLRKRKFKLHRLDTKLRFGFLYNGYRESTYYWEFIAMIRKLMIICSTVFLTTATITTQTASCASIFAVFFYIQYRYYPFEYENLNKTELGSNFVALITTWCGLFYIDSTPNQAASISFFLFILLSNAYFIFMWTRTIINELKQLAIEIFPFFKNYFDADMLKIKKSSEQKPIFSLINQYEDSSICIRSKNKIKSSVDLSIFKIKENIKIIEQQKSNVQSDESSGELEVSAIFNNQDIKEVAEAD